MSDNILAWLQDHEEVTSIRLLTPDINGIARGKRLPTHQAIKAVKGAARMPLSALNIDIWGEDIVDSPLVFESGDADGTLQPTSRGVIPAPWLNSPTALIPMEMYSNGAPFAGDPRHMLSRVQQQYKALGLTPVVATELEFHLFDGSSSVPKLPISPKTGQRLETHDLLSISVLDEFEDFFTDLYAACAAMGIPADAAISEAGAAQFEINLIHSADALRAADDAWLFKLATRGVARKHGFAASFMAKPLPNQPGNGMHTHFSVLDENGDNIFNDGGAKGTTKLRHAVGGLINAMAGSTLALAPHLNSYRRFQIGMHAPNAAIWGYENRTAAIRIPGGAPEARRIEHRVAGADTNPYIMLSAILGAALIGIVEEITPPDPVTGNGYAADAPLLPTSMADAIALFDKDPMVRKIFDPQARANIVMCKQQEEQKMRNADETFEFQTYLERV